MARYADGRHSRRIDTMADEDDPDDRITTAVLSESSYEQSRVLRAPPFGDSLMGMLAGQAALVGALALLLPMFAAFPPSMSKFLPSMDPARASPQILLLGVFGGVMVTFTASLLVMVGISRIRSEPLDERRAQILVNVETLAAYVGYVTGGVSIFLTLAYFCLGVAGGDAVASYVRIMDGLNPFEASAIGVSVAHVAAAAFTVFVGLLVVRGYLSVRLAELPVPEE